MSPEVIPLMVRAGFEYFCTDEMVLFRSLEAQGWKGKHAELFQAWRVEEEGVAMKVLFRERPLSDYIGFTASRTEAKVAAEHLRIHLENIAQVMPKDGVVLLALDGENAWEAFPDSGESFLEEFYQRLEKTKGLSSTLLGTYLDTKEGKPLGRLHSGSWIGGNFDIWIGDAEENQGWSWIQRTREFLLKEQKRGVAKPEVIAAAWEDLYAAQGSDWFWWYGPDFQTDSDMIFDALFRGRLQNVYRRLGVTPPPGLSVPICGAEMQLGTPPVREIEPRLSGTPSYLDWSGSGRYEAWRDQGAMAQGDRRVRTIHYGFGETDFYFRLEGKDGLGDEVVLDFHEPAAVRVRLRQGEGGWVGQVEKSVDGLEYAPVKSSVEVVSGVGVQGKVPFDSLGWGREGAEVSFLVRVIRGGVEVERYPERGLIEFRGPMRALDMKNWYI